MLNSINKSINQIDSLLDGWTFGRLVIESKGVHLELDTGEIIPVPIGADLEVRNGDQWQRLPRTELLKRTVDNWPAYAGLEARVR